MKPAYWVGTGIFLSRVAGLIRERVFAHYFGNSAASDAFKAALKIPNVLQNLFGEGVLSASFIPAYAGLVSREKKEDADHLASVVASLLGLVMAVLVLVGILTTPFLIDLVAPGFTGEKRALAIRLVQIFFPGTGLLVMSAWCLGILNSHRRFFLSYAAPIVWNAAIIASLVAFGDRSRQVDLAVIGAWGLVAGSALQFAIQLPAVLTLITHFRPSLALKLAESRNVIRNFFPMLLARGVVQISAYIDTLLASLLPTGAVSALAYAQVLYLLPISLFGMSVSAAELPTLSSATGTPQEIAAYLHTRFNRGLRQIAFFVVPSAIACMILGDVIVAMLFQSGEFTRADTLYVWRILAAFAVGLVAACLGRLYASTFYALRDTRTPLYFAMVRVVLGTGLGYLAALKLPGLLHIDLSLGVVGLAAASSVASGVEYLLLRRALNRRIGKTGVGRYHAELWGSALIAALAALAVKQVLDVPPFFLACAVLGLYGLLYFSLTSLLKRVAKQMKG